MEDSPEVIKTSPEWEPVVGPCFRNGWSKLWKYFLELFLIFIIVFVIGSPTFISNLYKRFGPFVSIYLGFLVFIYGILFLGPIKYGVAYAYLKATRSEDLKVKDMFDVFQNYWNAVLANLLAGVIIFLGFIFFVVPGIIFACKLAFVPYLVMDGKMEAVEAIKGSWRMTDGYATEVFLIGLLAIPIVIAGLLCFFVGVIIALMLIRLAFASLYHAVSLKKQEEVVQIE